MRKGDNTAACWFCAVDQSDTLRHIVRCSMAKSTVFEWRGRFKRRSNVRCPLDVRDAMADLRFVAGSWVKGTSVSKDEAFMFLTGHWRRSVLERLTHWQPEAEAGVHAMPEMMLAEAGRLLMRRLWMPLCPEFKTCAA